MKRLIISLILVATTSFISKAQYSMDYGFSLGGANYIGELGSQGDEPRPWILDMNLGNTRLSAGLYYRYNFTRNFALKFSANYARITSSDSTSKISSHIARNLSFRTEILEGILTGEYYFFTLNDLSRGASSRIDFGSYIFAGGGVALFYPYAEYQDKWYYLRPLQTEGTENAYKELTFVIPVGAGVNFTFNRRIRLGVEFGYRFSFTDYLDDVSTDYAFESELPFEESKIFASRSEEVFSRGEAGLPDPAFFKDGARRGNPNTKDGYLVGQVSLAYYIKGKNSFYKSRYNSIINRRRKRTKF